MTKKSSKLDIIDVQEIKTEIFINKHQNFSVKQLSEKYKVTPMQIARIARGENWSYVMPDLRRDKQLIIKTSKPVEKKIVSALIKGEKYQKEIAQMYSVNESKVSRIKAKYGL